MSQLKNSGKIFHVISNTHWDREWRYPFQRNRHMLVDMIDKLLDILETTPEYRAFHLDNQTIVIKDYLEVKPHKKPLIEKFVKEGRLFIGPWYILPEEYQVGGENLVRNLLLGTKISKEYGGFFRNGYSPFSWGQVSQLPQIYNGFGIDLIMFYRGINSLDAPKAEFLWEGADGTRALASRFSTMPRYNFYFYVYRPVVHNEFFSDVAYPWSRGGTPFHFADSLLYEEDYYTVNPVDQYFEEHIIPQVNDIIDHQADDFSTKHVLWMEGHDSSGPNKKTIRILKDARRLFPELDIRHSTLEEYGNAIRDEIDSASLKLVTGERRSAQFDHRSGNLYGYTTSARMYLKQANFDAERWLQYYAEPFNAIAGVLGKDVNDLFLDIAWEKLIENSAHDSIGGCSLDEIHEDMMNRYKQIIEISKGVFERAIKYLVQSIDASVFVSDGEHQEEIILLTAINPTMYKRNGVVKAFIDIPKEYVDGAFSIRDKAGTLLQLQICSEAETQPVLEQMTDRPMYIDMIRYECYIALSDIPSLGYSTFRVVPEMPKSDSEELLANEKNGNTILENDNLRIRINADTTFDLLEKHSNQEFKGIGYLLDEGEAGTAWLHKPIEPFVDSRICKPSISVTENGALSAKCRIDYVMMIPPDVKNRDTNEECKKEMPVSVTLGLQKDSRRVDLNIELINNSESHRLRMMFPTNIDAPYHYGEGQFDVVKRSSERPDTSEWIEQPMYDFPMHHFVDVSDENSGLAVLVDGLKEYEYMNDDEKTLAITLFRAFDFIIAPSSIQDYTHQKGSQELGSKSYKMALYPHTGNWSEANVYKEAMLFNYDIRLVQTGYLHGDNDLCRSFISVDSDNVVLSAIKKSESVNAPDEYIIRLFNPTECDIETELKLSIPIKNAFLVSLEEVNIKPLQFENNSIPLFFGKKKIVSVKVCVE